MALLNDIKQMQVEGKTEQEIISAMKQKGISSRDIIEALSQSKIKEAVGDGSEASPQYETPTPQDVQEEALMPSQESDTSISSQMQNSQPPQMSQEFAPAQPMQMEQSPIYQPQSEQANYQNYQQQPQQGNYQDYQQQPQGGISPDTITEISEQVVSEKLSSLKDKIENVLDLKTTMESKLESLDERLKRIEKIIDRLNLSILQKVGDYMTNIDDIKKELIETQKSFKSLVPSLDSPREKMDKAKKVSPIELE